MIYFFGVLSFYLFSFTFQLFLILWSKFINKLIVMWFLNILGRVLGFLFFTVLIPMILDNIFSKKNWLFIDIVRLKIMPALLIVVFGILRFGLILYAKKVGWLS